MSQSPLPEGLQENEETLVAQLWPIQLSFRHPLYKKQRNRRQGCKNSELWFPLPLPLSWRREVNAIVETWELQI
jgi:hypothetical protein